MIKPKLFIFAVVALASVMLVLGNWVTPVQANNTGIGTPTPTGTPIIPVTDIPGEAASAEQQEEIKSVIQAYFETRYRALSVSDSGDFQQKGFGNLVSGETEARVFLREEMGKLAVEIKRAELNHLRYVNYEYFLDFESITVDPITQTATVSVVEDNDVVYEISAELNYQEPVVSHMYDREHTISMRKNKNQWEIISDNYNDYLWRMLRQRGISTEEMIYAIETLPRVSISNAEASVSALANVLSADPSSHPYDRAGAVDYALNHAGSPNPNYYNYVNDGGDCTNFISQAIYEGGNASMSIPALPQPPSTGGDTNWYYLDYLRRAGAWTEVDSFYEFVTTAGWGDGPQGTLLLELDDYEVPETMPAGLMLGDVIQFEWGPGKDANGDQYWDHAVIVVGFAPDGTPYVASRTENYAYEPYMTFSPWQKIRFIHIEQSDGYSPIKVEIASAIDDAGGNPENPCPTTNWDAGNNYFGSCFNGGDITSGFIFKDVPIPDGAQLKYAYVTFTTDGTYGVVPGEEGQLYAPISLNIFGENSANPEVFSTGNTPADRATLPNSVTWQIDQTTNINGYSIWSWRGKRTTPDLISIIQPVVDLEGWGYGDSLSLIFKNALDGDTHHRRVIARESMTDTTYVGYWSARLVAAYTINDDPATTPPRVYSITRQEGSTSPTNATSVNFTVTFSEAVTGVDLSDFYLTATDLSGAELEANEFTATRAGVSGSGNTYTVTVNTNSDNNIFIRLNVEDSGTGIYDINNSLPLNGGFTTGEAFEIDKTAPIPVSITLTPPNPTSANSVDFTVNFSEIVTGVDISDFGLAFDSGISGANITSVEFLASQSWTVSVNTGSGDGNLRLVLLPNSTITDLATNQLYLELPGLFSAPYTVDKIAPSSSTSTLASSNPTSSSSVGFTVTFPEPVTNVDVNDFALTTTDLFGAAINGVSGSGSEYTVTVDTGHGDGTLRLDVSASANITDLAGNPLTGLPYTTGEAYTVIKNTGPFEGDEFDGPELATGWEWYVPKLGPTYSLSAVPGALRMSLPAEDSFEHWGTDDNAPQLRHIGLEYADWAIETRIEDINAAAGAGYWAALEVGFDQYDQVWFGITNENYLTEDRTNQCCAAFAIPETLPITLRLEKLGENYTFLYKHDADPDWIELATKNYPGTPIYLGLLGRSWYTGSSDLQIDWSYFHIEPWFAPPTVTSVTRNDANPTNAGSVGFTVTFSEAVTGVDSGDFALDAPGLSEAVISNVSGSGSTYTVTVNTGSGEGALRLDVVDNDTIINSASKPLGGGFTSGEVYTLDRTAPSIISIMRASADPTSEVSVDFTLTFSENVTGVDLSDFALMTYGVVGAALSDINGVDNVYTVTVNTGVGGGIIRLDVIDDDTIVDTVGNPLGGTGTGNGDYTLGEVYTVDKNITLVVTSVAAQDGYVLESSETSNTGGTVNTGATTFYVGDNAQDRQYRSMLSFGTSGLPDNAVIVSAQLKLKLQSVSGTNPFTTHSDLLVDIRQPYFGAGVALQTDDFAAAAGAEAVATVDIDPTDGYYLAFFEETGLTHINKTGSTQLRLRFQLDDNDDLGADYLAFYSANSGTASYRPVLEIVYYIP
ncbi:MAG: amidase domain-containing protein [Chloroflexota bacterium]